MLVARFSDNIEADIKRGWSTWMLPGLGGSYEDCLQDIEDFGFRDAEIREFPEYPGCYGVVHHEGLSCYPLESENVDDAIAEVLDSKLDGSGYASATIGKVTLLKSVSSKEIRSIRDLHILEVDDCETEDW